MCPLLVLGEECGPCVVARHAGSLSVQLLLGIVLRRRGRRKPARPFYLYTQHSRINRINAKVTYKRGGRPDWGHTPKSHTSRVRVLTRALPCAFLAELQSGLV